MTNPDPSWNLLNSDFEIQGNLPFPSTNFKLILNEPGSGTLRIPMTSQAADLVQSGMLAVPSYRGSPRAAISIDNIKKNHAEEGNVDGGLWLEMSGSGEMILLEDAVVLATGNGTGTKRQFTGTLASVLILLLEEAQSRADCLPNIIWDFTATHDSAGVAWSDNMPVSFTVGITLLEVVRQIAKWGIDFRMVLDGNEFVLQAYKNGIGSNKSSTVFFRVGLNCLALSEEERAGSLKNSLHLVFRDGVLEVKDDTSISSYRRREKFFDVRNAQTAEAVATYGSAVLESYKNPRKSIVIKVYDGIGPEVFEDYSIGDTVSFDTSESVTSQRIIGMQMDWDGNEYSNVILELASIFTEHEITMSRDIDQLMEYWRTAKDTNSLEVRYWAALGDTSRTYPTLGAMVMVGEDLYIGGNLFLARYNLTTGTWTNLSCDIHIADMKELDGKIYIAGIDPNSSNTPGVCDDYAFVYDIATDTLELLGGGLGITTVGMPPSSSAFTVEINGTDVYIGGRFGVCPTGAVGPVVKWDTIAETWTDLGAGSLGASGNFVYKLLHDGTDLWAVGNFSTIGGVGTAKCVARYDGTWHAVGTTSSFTSVVALAKLGENLIVGGTIPNYIQQWDGSSWSVFGEGVNGSVLDIQVYLTDVYVSGNFTDKGSKIAKYSGGQWWELQEGLEGGSCQQMYLYDNGDGVDVYVYGTFNEAGDKPANQIAAYLTNFGSLMDYLERSPTGFDMAAAIHAAPEKTTLNAEDEIGIWDSISKRLRKISWTTILEQIQAWADTIYVALTGDQSVDGIKTFLEFPFTPPSAPTDDYQVANKKYVDDNSGSGGGTPGGINTQVQFNDGGSFGGDAEFTWDETNKVLGIGDPSHFPSVSPNRTFWMVGDGISPSQFMVAYGATFAPFHTFMKADGSAASPANVKANQIIGRTRGRGYDGTAWTDTRVEIRLVADGDWGSGDTPTRIEIWTTPAGSSTLTLVLTIGSDQHVNIPSGKEYRVDGSQHLHNAVDISVADSAAFFYGANAEDVLQELGFDNRSFETITASASTTGLTAGSATLQILTGTNFHTIDLPDTSTIFVTRKYHLINRSTGIAFIRTYGTDNLIQLAPDFGIVITCVSTSDNTPASWHLTKFNEELLELSDVITGDADDTRHGFLRKLSGNANEFMNGEGNWVEVEASGGRELLTANRTYYVRTDGSDSNTGLVNDSSGAFLTIQKAVDIASSLDVSVYDVTIQIGDGTYTESVVLKNAVGAGKIILQGNTSSMTSVVVRSFTKDGAGTTYKFSYLKFTGSSTYAAILVSNGGYVTFGNVDFGSGFTYHVETTFGGNAVCVANYTISGGASFAHISARAGGGARVQSKTVTLSGTPAFSTQGFVECRYGSTIFINGNTFSGSATGKRYYVDMNAVIQSVGATLPGNAGGSSSNGGIYA